MIRSEANKARFPVCIAFLGKRGVGSERIYLTGGAYQPARAQNRSAELELPLVEESNR